MYRKAEVLLDEYLGNIREHYGMACNSLDNWNLHRLHVEDTWNWIHTYLETIEAFSYVGLIGDDEVYDRTTYVQNQFINRGKD